MQVPAILGEDIKTDTYLPGLAAVNVYRWAMATSTAAVGDVMVLHTSAGTAGLKVSKQTATVEGLSVVGIYQGFGGKGAASTVSNASMTVTGNNVVSGDPIQLLVNGIGVTPVGGPGVTNNANIAIGDPLTWIVTAAQAKGMAAATLGYASLAVALDTVASNSTVSARVFMRAL